jgi:hypothetical protein
MEIAAGLRRGVTEQIHSLCMLVLCGVGLTAFFGVVPWRRSVCHGVVKSFVG